MPRTSKGARLVWRKESLKADGSLRSRAGWFIRDGSKFLSTGGGQTDRERADRALAAYITEKYQPARERGRDPADILVADVINVYLKDVAPKHARPQETAARLMSVLDYFADKTLADINGDMCRDFVSKQSTPAYGRRQLEDLRAAIRHFWREGYCTSAPAIVLPDKAEPRDTFLTRGEAARLLWSAWRMKQSWKGQESDRRTGRHLARFILVALYTGSRSAAICGAAIRPTEGSGYVDLDSGVFYRRAQRSRKKKTKKRQPPVRLPSRLVAHMRRWRDTTIDDRPIAKDYVVEWNGKPVISVKKSFRSACKLAGLGDDVKPHSLRHTAATWLMQAGADVWEAAGFLGMTPEMLVDTYGHHHPDFQANAAEKITSKRAMVKAPKNVVRLDGNKPATPVALPHTIPTAMPETNVNIRDKAG